MFTRKEDEMPPSGNYSTPSSPTTGGSAPASTRSTAGGGSDTNAISKGTRIRGDVYCEGNLRIDGEVTGKIFSQSKVTIGKSGFVDGNIQCVQAEILGRIKGALTVQDHLFLRSEAKMDGDVLTTHFEMEPTVRFNGKCTMQDKVELKPVANTTEKPAATIPNTASHSNSSSTSNTSGNTLNKSAQNNKSNNLSDSSDSRKNAEKKVSTGLFQK